MSGKTKNADKSKDVYKPFIRVCDNDNENEAYQKYAELKPFASIQSLILDSIEQLPENPIKLRELITYMCKSCSQTAESKDAFSCFKASIKLIKTKNQTWNKLLYNEMLALFNHFMSLTYYRVRDYVKAYDFSYKASDYVDLIYDALIEGNTDIDKRYAIELNCEIYNQVAASLIMIPHYDEAFDFYNNTIEIINDLKQDVDSDFIHSITARQYFVIGNKQYDLNMTDDAIKSLNLAKINFSKDGKYKIGDLNLIAKTHEYLGFCYQKKNDRTKSEKHFSKARASANEAIKIDSENKEMTEMEDNITVGKYINRLEDSDTLPPEILSLLGEH